MKANVKLMGYEGVAEVIREENGYTVMIDNKTFYVSDNSKNETVMPIKERIKFSVEYNESQTISEYNYDTEGYEDSVLSGDVTITLVDESKTDIIFNELTQYFPLVFDEGCGELTVHTNDFDKLKKVVKSLKMRKF